MCEEAILKDKRESIKKEQLSKHLIDDEIALKVEASKPKPHKLNPSLSISVKFLKAKMAKRVVSVDSASGPIDQAATSLGTHPILGNNRNHHGP
jgi:hypothetical protein